MPMRTKRFLSERGVSVLPVRLHHEGEPKRCWKYYEDFTPVTPRLTLPAEQYEPRGDVKSHDWDSSGFIREQAAQESAR